MFDFAPNWPGCNQCKGVEMAEREFVALEPGDYWIISADGRGRAIVTSQRELLIEQFGGEWSCLGVGICESWVIKPREFTDDEIREWNASDERVKQWRSDLAAARKRAVAVERLARDLFDLAPQGGTWPSGVWVKMAEDLMSLHPGLLPDE